MIFEKMIFIEIRILQNESSEIRFGKIQEKLISTVCFNSYQNDPHQGDERKVFILLEIILFSNDLFTQSKHKLHIFSNS